MGDGFLRGIISLAIVLILRPVAYSVVKVVGKLVTKFQRMMPEQPAPWLP